MVSLLAYEELLKNHDWNYEYSTDRKKWSAGNLSYQEIIKYSKQSEEHKALFKKYKK